MPAPPAGGPALHELLIDARTRMKLDTKGRPADSPPDRRKDQVMADLVEIGLLFTDVFGRERGASFFRCTIVAPHVYQRVLLGGHRRHGPREEPDEFAFAG
jgi:hypothetical protein